MPTLIFSKADERKNALIYNNHTQPIFLADSQGSCTLLGFPLAAGAVLEVARFLSDNPADELWGIVAAATADIRIWQTVREDPDYVMVNL